MARAKPLASEEEYQAALAEMEGFFDQEPQPGTPAAARFAALAVLIDDYEEEHWPVD